MLFKELKVFEDTQNKPPLTPTLESKDIEQYKTIKQLAGDKLDEA